MKNKFFDYLFIILSMILLLVSVSVYFLFEENGNHALPFILFGCACGLLGHGIGNILAQKAQEKDPELVKRINIEVKDERNTEIRNLAKAKAFDIMIYIFGALVLLFAIMDMPPAMVLLLCVAYIAVIVIFILNFKKLNKEM